MPAIDLVHFPAGLELLCKQQALFNPSNPAFLCLVAHTPQGEIYSFGHFQVNLVQKNLNMNCLGVHACITLVYCPPGSLGAAASVAAGQ